MALSPNTDPLFPPLRSVLAGVTAVAFVLFAAYASRPNPQEAPPAPSTDSTATHPPNVAAPLPATRLADTLFALDYSDPTRSGVPLIAVKGREDAFLSPYFRVKDFMARDGAPYARIAPELVKTLDLIAWLAEAEIFINSGYRHPALNEDPAIGGAPLSYHLAGQAADIWSPDKASLELAEVALTVMECRMGLGLGATFIHVDVRDYLAVWAQEDAALDEHAFREWVQERCPDYTWDVDSTAVDSALTAPADGSDTGLPPPTPDPLVARYHAAMAAFAADQARLHGPGAVVLDLRQNAPAPDSLSADRLTYALPGSDAARERHLDPLIHSVDPDHYYVFSILRPGDEETVGVNRYTSDE